MRNNLVWIWRVTQSYLSLLLHNIHLSFFKMFTRLNQNAKYMLKSHIFGAKSKWIFNSIIYSDLTESQDVRFQKIVHLKFHKFWEREWIKNLTVHLQNSLWTIQIKLNSAKNYNNNVGVIHKNSSETQQFIKWAENWPMLG